MFNFRIGLLIFCTVVFLFSFCSSDPNKRTTYYEDGTIYTIEEINEKKQREGIVQFYDSIGQLEVNAEYANDSLNGLMTTYYPNGTVRSTSYWNKGKQSGEAIGYYESGVIKYTGTYSNGKRVVLIDFTENGEKRTEQHYDGDTVIYFERSELTREQGRNSVGVRSSNRLVNVKSGEVLNLGFVIEDAHHHLSDSLIVWWELSSPTGTSNYVEKVTSDTVLFRLDSIVKGSYKLKCTVREYINTQRLIILRDSDSTLVNVN